MKRKFYKLIILLLILSAFSLLMLTSCSETPDEPVTDNPPEQNPIEEQITTNMSYAEVSALIGTDGTPAEIGKYVYWWDLKNGEKLYIRFDKSEPWNSDKRTFVVQNVIGNSLSITEGMTLGEILDMLGSHDSENKRVGCLYAWEAGELDLYCWFDNAPSTAMPRDRVLIRYEYRKDTHVKYGMTYDDIAKIYCKEGSEIIENLYVWEGMPWENLYVVFDESTVKEYYYGLKPKFHYDIINSYADVVALLGTEGTRVQGIPSLYKWDTDDDDFLYIWFEEATNEIYSHYELIPYRYVKSESVINGIIEGMTYEEVCNIFGIEGKIASIGNLDYEVYMWKINSTKAGIFTFEKSDSTLVLSDFGYVTDVSDCIGKSYDDVIDLLNIDGERCATPSQASCLYKFKTNQAVDLYVSFDEAQNATNFSYRKDIELRNGMTVEEACFILGTPIYNKADGGIQVRWEANSEEEFVINFHWMDGLSYSMYLVPKFYLELGMTYDEAVETIGKVHDEIKGSGRAFYYWYIDEFSIMMTFENYGKANHIKIYLNTDE